MKRNWRTLKTIVVVVFAATALLLFSACGSGGSQSGSSAPDPSDLLGTWQEVDIDNSYTFKADGTGSEHFEGDTWEMTWTLSDSTLTMDFPATGVEEYEITLSGNTLKVHNPIVDYEYTRK